MRVAITGGTGFVGRHLAQALVSDGHEVVLIARGVDQRDEDIRSLPNTQFFATGVDDVEKLRLAFDGCDAVAHCAGINREIGAQTYQAVHIQGTENVVGAARSAGVKHVILLSFLRARPDCNSGYHESKWAAEQTVRASGIPFTVFKAGVTYGKGDHFLDHISHALQSFPVFLLVGYRSLPCAPLAVEDLVTVLIRSLTKPDLKNKTVAITGPETITLAESVTRIADVIGKHRLTVRAPIWLHYCLAWFFEHTMRTPLAALCPGAHPHRDPDRTLRRGFADTRRRDATDALERCPDPKGTPQTKALQPPRLPVLFQADPRQVDRRSGSDWLHSNQGVRTSRTPYS